MSTFSDNFNRADGGLGNDWFLDNGTITIVSNHASATATGWARQGTINASGRQECIMTLTVAAIADLSCGPFIKANSPITSGYTSYATGSLASPTWHVRRVTTNNFITDVTVGGSAISAGEHTVRLLYNAGILTLWVDGAFILTTADSTHGANTSAGFRIGSASSAVNDYTLLGDEAVTLSVSPSPIGNYGSTTDVTFTGLATSWTPGTPGTPTFTVDHGTLTAQTVDSATTAHATYDPGTFLGIATFTDPSTGATCLVTVTSNPETLPPDLACPFDEDFITTANATVLASNRGLPTLESIVVPAAEGYDPVAFLEALTDIYYAHFRPELLPGPGGGSGPTLELLWELINGAEAYVEGSDLNSLLTLTKADADQLQAFFKLSDPTYATIDDVVGILGGSPTVLSHQDLKTAIDNIQGGSNQDVLDALAAYFGENPPTIEQLGTMVSDIATIAGYDLGDVLTAIAAIPTNTITSLQPVLDRLDDIQPSGTDTLTTIQAAIVPSSAIQAIVDAGTLALAGEEGATIAAVLDAIAALQPASGGGAPVWPGLDGVTFGTPAALTGQLHIEGTMDGVIVAVTTPPTHTGLRVIGGANYDYNVGEIAFETDNGDIEPWQYMGFRAAIFTPKTMAHAAGARFRILAGAEGTVTPWTVS